MTRETMNEFIKQIKEAMEKEQEIKDRIQSPARKMQRLSSNFMDDLRLDIDIAG